MLPRFNTETIIAQLVDGEGSQLLAEGVVDAIFTCCCRGWQEVVVLEIDVCISIPVAIAIAIAIEDTIPVPGPKKMPRVINIS